MLFIYCWYERILMMVIVIFMLFMMLFFYGGSFFLVESCFMFGCCFFGIFLYDFDVINNILLVWFKFF